MKMGIRFRLHRRVSLMAGTNPPRTNYQLVDSIRLVSASTRWRRLGTVGLILVLTLPIRLLFTLLAGELVKVGINHRRGEQRQHLRNEQPADDGIAQWLAEFGTGAAHEDHRQAAQPGAGGGHQDWAEPFERGFESGIFGAQVFLAPRPNGTLEIL